MEITDKMMRAAGKAYNSKEGRPRVEAIRAALEAALSAQVHDVVGPNTSLLREALEAIVSGGNKPELSIHDLQRNRYSKWAVDIARAALAAPPAKQEG